MGVTVDPAFRSLIPADTTVLAGVNWEKLRTSELYQRYQGQWKAQLDAFGERFGIDPRRDVAALCIAANGKGSVVAFAKGRFTEESLRQKLLDSGAQMSQYKGHHLYGDPRQALTFLKDGVVAAGPMRDLRRWVDDSEVGHNGIPEALQRRLETLPKNDAVWVVSEGGLPFQSVPLRPDVQSALSNIEGIVTGVAAGAAVDSGVHVQADFTCVSGEGAQRVHDALKGGIGLARLTTKDDALDMLRLYDSIQVTKDGQVVRVRADWPGSLIDKVWGQLQQAIGRANRAFSSGQ